MMISFANAKVSTHSRPKAAGSCRLFSGCCVHVSTHSRPKAAGHSRPHHRSKAGCFNTQPPEGGWPMESALWSWTFLFQHTAARRRLVADNYDVLRLVIEFQHTAARRRLASPNLQLIGQLVVSTHSRPKAAGCRQPHRTADVLSFQHTAARRRLGN